MTEALITIDVDPKAQAIIEKGLATLPEKLFERAVRSAIVFAATPMLKEAKKRAPVSKEGKKDHPPGFLRDNIVRKSVKYKTTKTVWVGIGPDRRVPYGHLVEFGHRIAKGGTLARESGRTAPKSKVTGKAGGGAFGGRVPPNPFLEVAFNNNARKAVERYREKIVKAINKQAKKAFGRTFT